MKKIIFIIALLGLSFIEIYSQTKKLFKMDTSFRSISGHIRPTPFIIENSNDSIRLLEGPAGANSLFPKNKTGEVFAEPKFFDNLKRTDSYDRMPVIKPRGFYSMRIYRPDSSVRYSLLIKKF